MPPKLLFLFVLILPCHCFALLLCAHAGVVWGEHGALHCLQLSVSEWLPSHEVDMSFFCISPWDV